MFLLAASAQTSNQTINAKGHQRHSFFSHVSHSNYAFTNFHVSRQACRPWTHHVAFMYKQTVSKKEFYPYFWRYGSIHNSIVRSRSSQASTCSQLAKKIDSELIAFLSRANSFKTNHSFCLITGQFWFAGMFFWGDRNKLNFFLPFGHVSLLRYVVIMNLIRRRNKNQNKTK